MSWFAASRLYRMPIRSCLFLACAPLSIATDSPEAPTLIWRPCMRISPPAMVTLFALTTVAAHPESTYRPEPNTAAFSAPSSPEPTCSSIFFAVTMCVIRHRLLPSIFRFSRPSS